MRAHRVLAVVAVLLFAASFTFGQSRRRTVPFEFPYQTVGATLCNCEGFDVKYDLVGLVRGRTIYDKAGEAVQDVWVDRVIGQSRYYNSEDEDLFVLGGPGEVGGFRFTYANGTYYWTGPLWKIRVPGYGPIFYETGHLIWDTIADEIVFNSGQNQWIDGDVEALCKYLTPAP